MQAGEKIPTPTTMPTRPIASVVVVCRDEAIWRQVISAPSADNYKLTRMADALDIQLLVGTRQDAVVVYAPDLTYFGGTEGFSRLLHSRPELQESAVIAIDADQRYTHEELKHAGAERVITAQHSFKNVFAAVDEALRSPTAVSVSRDPITDGQNSMIDADASSDTKRTASSSISPESPSSARTKNSENICRSCERWRPDPEDRCCAWCGGPLILAVVDPRDLHFSAQDTKKVLHLRNDGVNPLFTVLSFIGESRQCFRVEPEFPDNLYEVQPSEGLSLTVTFSPESANLTGDCSSELLIETNAPGEHETLTVPLVVERPPKGILVPPPPKRPKLIYGDDPVLKVSVRNAGGGILTITRLEISDPKLLETTVNLSSAVSAGQEVALRIPLSLEKLTPGQHIIKGRVELSECPALDFSREVDFERPPRLRLDKQILRSELYRIGRRDHQQLKVTNLGDEPVKIEGVDSDKGWLTSLCKNSVIPARREGWIDVFVDGTDLPIGAHSGNLIIRSNSYDGLITVCVEADVSKIIALTDAMGVDFGTSLSCIATVRDGKPELVHINPEGDSKSVEGFGLPSVVFFEENLFPIVGSQAETYANIYPAAAVHSVKRILGSQRPLSIRGQDRTPVAVASEIFRALLSSVERSLIPPASPVHAVLTVPADISDQQIAGVLEAAARAGLDVDHTERQEFVIDEPSAAALYYLWRCREQQNVAHEELVFIYDLGAGTLDCSLVLIERQQNKILIKVLASTGDRRLGGDDIDLAIARHVGARLRASHQFDDSPLRLSRKELNALAADDWAAYLRAVEMRSTFCRYAERMKIEIGSAGQAKAEFPAGASHVECLVTNEQLEEILLPFLEISDLVVQGCCNLAAVPPDRIHSVLHSGRMSALPTIRQRVNRQFTAATDKTNFIEAKSCVALGAAWWAYIKNLPGVDIDFEGFTPKLPHAIGYYSVEGLQPVFKTVFPAGQSCPAEKTVLIPWLAGRRFRLEIHEQRFGLGAVCLRGSVLLPAMTQSKAHACTFRLSPNRVLEIFVGEQKLAIDTNEEE